MAKEDGRMDHIPHWQAVEGGMDHIQHCTTTGAMSDMRSTALPLDVVSELHKTSKVV